MDLWSRFRQSRRCANAIAKFFQFDQHQAKLSTEILAGVTTFVTMAYILVVK
ncbi:MAG: NCS2 family permease, partial [Moorea sp. SIO4G2]|nr:NCS2 family permease [Moorena sp. SIO4G2]